MMMMMIDHELLMLIGCVNVNVQLIEKFREFCWNFSIRWTALTRLSTSRYVIYQYHIDRLTITSLRSAGVAAPMLLNVNVIK